jgi:hypothetical protein
VRLTRLMSAWGLAIFLAASGSEAMAYIGPGAGAGLIATVLGVIVAFVLALIGIIYYPIKRFLSRLKSRAGRRDDAIKDDH